MINVIVTIICLIPFIMGILIVIGLFIKFISNNDREVSITFEINRNEGRN